MIRLIESSSLIAALYRDRYRMTANVLFCPAEMDPIRNPYSPGADSPPPGATGEQGMGRYVAHRVSPTHDEIAQLAFNLYESRGRRDGYHLEDWLRAEQELTTRVWVAQGATD